jgi:hypothetical protein
LKFEIDEGAFDSLAIGRNASPYGHRRITVPAYVGAALARIADCVNRVNP